MFEVRFLDYTNPGNRNGQKTCCIGEDTGGSCSSPCSTFFKVCLRPLTHTGPSCPFGQKTSDVLGNGSFEIPSNSLLQIPWPSTLQSWPVSTNLLTHVLTLLYLCYDVRVKNISFAHAALLSNTHPDRDYGSELMRCLSVESWQSRKGVAWC